MDLIWAPWRIWYIQKATTQNGVCFLCSESKTIELDEDNFVLYRGKNCFALLNTYPYNNGHILIAPYRHVRDLKDLTDDEIIEVFRISKIAVNALEKSMGAQGYNIGFNVGEVAGAGCADHIHLHIVPRWSGDTNFMPILGNVKIISEALKNSYERLLPYFRGVLK